MAGIDAISGLTGLISPNKSAKSSGGSDFAAVLAQAQASQDSAATAEAAPDELLSSFQKNMHDFRDRVEQLLEKLGIDTNGQPLQVQLNLLQQLIVSGDHPQAAEAQAALQQDPQLTSLFTMLQQQAEQLESRKNPDAKPDPGKPFALQIDGAHLTQVKYS